MSQRQSDDDDFGPASQRVPEPTGTAEPDASRTRAPLADSFHRAAVAASQQMGSPWAFIAAVSIVVGWALLGPLFDYGDSWQLVINTGTTIITFLMVFLIQSSQNRDARALHLKLDELIRTSRARNVFADLEDATEQELDAFQEEFRQLHSQGIKGADAALRARELLQRRRPRS